MLRVVTSLALTALALWAPAALGFSVRHVGDDIVNRWLVSPVTYYVQLAGSDDISPDLVVPAVRRGFAAWAAVDCATITFEELGDAPDPHVVTLVTGAGNGRNEFVFIEDATWSLGASVLAVTTPLTETNGEITEADIAFNGYHHRWTTAGNGGSDVEGIAIHEIGHMIGAQHNLGPYDWNEPPTMGPSGAPGVQSRTLERDDQNAACFLYPRVPYTCEGEADCPFILDGPSDSEHYGGKYHCVDGVCSNIEHYRPRLALVGEECRFLGHCADGLECYPFGAASICARVCAPAAADCPAGFECAAAEPPYHDVGFCLPTDGELRAPGTGPDGCVNGQVCGEGLLCLPTPVGDSQRCAELCTAGDDETCPTDKRCWSYGGETGGCFGPSSFPSEPAEPGPSDVSADTGGGDAAAERVTEADARQDGGCVGAGGGPGGALVYAIWLLVAARRRVANALTR